MGGQPSIWQQSPCHDDGGGDDEGEDDDDDGDGDGDDDGDDDPNTTTATTNNGNIVIPAKASEDDIVVNLKDDDIVLVVSSFVVDDDDDQDLSSKDRKGLLKNPALQPCTRTVKKGTPRLMNGQNEKKIWGKDSPSTYSTDRVKIRKEGQTLKARTTEGHRAKDRVEYEGQTCQGEFERCCLFHWLTWWTLDCCCWMLAGEHFHCSTSTN